MKKPNYIRVVLAASLFCASIFLSPKIFAQEVGEEEEIEFGIDDTPGDPGASKTPILVPTAWLNGHVVDFHGTHADYVLRIVDWSIPLLFPRRRRRYGYPPIWLVSTASSCFGTAISSTAISRCKAISLSECRR